MSGLRIFIADDHEMVRRVLTALLRFHPDWVVCGEASNGQEAVQFGGSAVRHGGRRYALK